MVILCSGGNLYLYESTYPVRPGLYFCVRVFALQQRRGLYRTLALSLCVAQTLLRSCMCSSSELTLSHVHLQCRARTSVQVSAGWLAGRCSWCVSRHIAVRCSDISLAGFFKDLSNVIPNRFIIIIFQTKFPSSHPVLPVFCSLEMSLSSPTKV